MKRINYHSGDLEENLEVDLFLSDIANVYRKHGLEISSEDSQEGVVVMRVTEKTYETLDNASMLINPETSVESVRETDSYNKSHA